MVLKFCQRHKGGGLGHARPQTGKTTLKLGVDFIPPPSNLTPSKNIWYKNMGETAPWRAKMAPGRGNRATVMGKTVPWRGKMAP